MPLKIESLRHEKKNQDVFKILCGKMKRQSQFLKVPSVWKDGHVYNMLCIWILVRATKCKILDELAQFEMLIIHFKK